MSEKDIYSGLEHLGKASPIPADPSEAELERVTNPHPDTLYLARFVCPEFTSLCPVTGQPDWGSIWIQYAGPEIDRAGLLRYIVSYRNHQGFHEEAVERMILL